MLVATLDVAGAVSLADADLVDPRVGDVAGRPELGVFFADELGAEGTDESVGHLQSQVAGLLGLIVGKPAKQGTGQPYGGAMHLPW